MNMKQAVTVTVSQSLEKTEAAEWYTSQTYHLDLDPFATVNAIGAILSLAPYRPELARETLELARALDELRARLYALPRP